MPHLDAIVIHCRQPAALAGFYAKVLGLPVAPADVAAIEAGTLGPDESVLLGSRDALHVWLTPVRALEPVPGRVHLDVRLDVDGDLDRLIALGATRQWEGPKGGWTVLADPEGNLSVPCIRSSDASRRATPDRAGQSPCNRGPASPTGVSNQDQN